MSRTKFDPNAAFKSIVGLKDEPSKGVDYNENLDIEKSEETKVTIEKEIKEETRSRRVNLVIKPSVYIKAKKKCETLNISLNECINQFLEKWGKE